tara:strand:+ start:283 stop:567 length:285 start_codon:yes stop_codon:yes gene_type:complete
MYSPSVGLVGTPKDVFMTSDSEGALMSAGGRWNIMGALYSVPDDIVCCSKIFPAGRGFTVNVLTSMLAGVPNTSWLHHGVTALMYAAVGVRLVI